MDIPHFGEDKRILGSPLYGKQTPSSVFSIQSEDPQSHCNPSKCNQFMLFIFRNWMGLQCKEAAWFPQLAPKSGSHVEGVHTPFSRPTRNPGGEFSLGGDFFPPSNFDRRVGEISPPPSKFHRRVGEISSPPCRYPPHSPFQIFIFWKMLEKLWFKYIWGIGTRVKLPKVKLHESESVTWEQGFCLPCLWTVLKWSATHLSIRK